MSPNAPVPPPPPPPGGAPVPAGGQGGQAAPAWQRPAPPTFAPSGQHRSPAADGGSDGQATVVHPAVPAHDATAQATVVQRVTPTSGLPTAAQPVVQAPTPVPPQRVRYATEQAGPGAGYAPTAAYAPAPSPSQAAPAAAPRPAYHPPAAGVPTGAAGAPPATGGGRSTPPRGDSRGGSSGSSGRRLGPGWIAFIVLDVLLVVGAVVFGVSLLGGDEGGEPAGSVAGPSADATQDAAPEQPAPTVTETFASETRNITCEMTDVGVTCAIAELATQPAPVAGCEGAVGYQVVLDADGVRQPCVPASEQPQPAAADVPVLPYGESRTVGAFTCNSENTGMTCRDDATGQGFTVAKAGIRSL